MDIPRLHRIQEAESFLLPLKLGGSADLLLLVLDIKIEGFVVIILAIIPILTHPNIQLRPLNIPATILPTFPLAAILS